MYVNFIIIREHSLYDLNPFKLIETSFRAQNIIYLNKCSKTFKMDLLLNIWSIGCLNVRSSLFIVLLMSSVSLLIIFAEPTFAITQKEVMKYLSITLGSSVFPCSCVFCFI